MKRCILIVGIHLFSFAIYAQSRAIYIDDIGPADGAVTPVLILRDSNDVNIENFYDLMPFISVFGINYSNPQDFDLLECILKKEVKSSENKGNMYWNNFRIVFLDESFNITAERFICCDKETAKTFKKLLKLKSVSSNQFISDLFSNYISLIEADYMNK